MTFWLGGQRYSAVEVRELPGPAAAGSGAGGGLFQRVARPLATPAMAGWWLAGRRLVAVDGACLDVADTAPNAEYFGRPGVNKGEQAAFPQARLVGLAECGTHALFAAAIGRYSESEAVLTGQLLGRLEPGMLLLADRGFFSYAPWRGASATGADLLWLIRTDPAGPQPTHVQDLSDGSWLADLRKSTDRHGEPMRVRVVDYTIDDGRDNPVSYRLFTMLVSMRSPRRSSSAPRPRPGVAAAPGPPHEHALGCILCLRA